MESGHGCCTAGLGLVIHESAVALRDEENTLNIVGCITGEVVFQIDDVSTGRQITNPKGVSRLLGLSWRSTDCRCL